MLINDRNKGIPNAVAAKRSLVAAGKWIYAFEGELITVLNHWVLKG